LKYDKSRKLTPQEVEELKEILVPGVILKWKIQKEHQLGGDAYNSTRVIIISLEEYSEGRYPSGNKPDENDFINSLIFRYLDGQHAGSVNGYWFQVIHQMFDLENIINTEETLTTEEIDKIRLVEIFDE